MTGSSAGGAADSPRFERRSADWLEVEEAVARVLAGVSPLPSERAPLSEAAGRALAEEIRATATLPPWDNSAMDGYAVLGADVEGASAESPVTLEVTSTVRAGERIDRPVRAGEAIRIMTGGPIPDAADTVIRVEDTDREEEPGRVRILSDRDRGRHIRPAGRDMRDGELLLARGHTITPGTVGVLAAAGCSSALVHRRPTVGILSTGDELRTTDAYDEVRAGRGVPDSNRPMLEAMANAVGARPVDLGIAGDDPDALERRLRAGAECDVLVTVGGASMGDADLVKRVLDTLGYRSDFWRVKMRPGSPFGFGRWPTGSSDQPVFGLPGNPASAFVTFELFVRPYLMRLGGHARVLRRRVTCTARDTISAPAALTHFQRVALTAGAEGLEAGLTGLQGSGLVSGLARVDGLAVIPPDVTVVEPGDRVEVMLLDGSVGDGGAS